MFVRGEEEQLNFKLLSFVEHPCRARFSNIRMTSYSKGRLVLSEPGLCDPRVSCVISLSSPSSSSCSTNLLLFRSGRWYET